MKKYLVAVIALLSAGGAFAQWDIDGPSGISGSVAVDLPLYQVYGKAEAGLQYTAPSVVTAAGAQTAVGKGTSAVNGYLFGSRWGLRGAKAFDVLGGTSAIYQFEAGFNLLTGQAAMCGGQNVVSVNACSTVTGQPGSTTSVQPDRIFSRQAYAGFKSSTWGQVSLGRQYSPHDNALSLIDPQILSTNSAMSLAWKLGGSSDGNGNGGRIDNSLTYYSPDKYPVRAQLMWASGANRTQTVGASSYNSWDIRYVDGPWDLLIGAENLKSNGLVNANSTNGGPAGTGRNLLFGGSYRFEWIKPFIGFEHDKNAVGTKDTGWGTGIVTKIYNGYQAKVGYARETSTTVAGVKTRSKYFSGQLIYMLDKSTYLYSGWVDGTNGAVVGLQKNKDRTASVGFDYSF